MCSPARCLAALLAVLLLLLPQSSAAAEDFDLLPPPAYADFSPYQMTVPLALPVERPDVNSPFGWRFHPLSGVLDFHTGIDLSGKEGSPIRAALSGTVETAGFHPSYGNYLILDHHNGFSTLYAHCSRLLAEEGDVIRKGETIAEIGYTGDATGPHLHFEVRLNGVCLDPALALGISGIPEGTDA